MYLDSRGYAYETYREDGRVRRRYIGRGGWVASALRLDERDRERAEETKQDERAQIGRLTNGTEALQAYCKASDCVFREAMKAGGYHQHKRGQWRKRRANPMSKTKPTGESQNLVTSNKEHYELLKRANNGDKDAAAQALAIVKGLPEEGPLLDTVAPLLEMASSTLINLVTDNELRRAGYRRRLEIMRDEMAGPKPSALELHLAERAALCALAVSNLERLYTQNFSSGTKVWEVCGRQLDGAHRRHLSAVKALAEVRRLKLPSIQVNIGENQVNMGAGGVAVVTPPAPVKTEERGRIVDAVAH